MAVTYEPIATTTLGSATATVTFSSISATYTDLVLVIAARTTVSGTNNSWLRFNSDTATNYSTTRLQGDGSSAASNRSTSTNIGYVGLIPGSDAASNVFSATTVNIQNYANTTTYKTSIGRGNTNTYTNAAVMLWRKTPEAINSITIGSDSGNLDTGSTFTLYGIKAA